MFMNNAIRPGTSSSYRSTNGEGEWMRQQKIRDMTHFMHNPNDFTNRYSYNTSKQCFISSFLNT